MRKGLLAALVLAVGLMMAGVAAAQEQATAVLKSGERVSGELIDMGGSHFEFRVNGQQRRIPIGEVAVIDFAGGGQNLPESELNRVSEGRNIVVLRSGEVVEGKLYDVSGKKPLKLTVNTTAGMQREFRSDEVGRIYLDKPSATAAGTSGSTPSAGEGARTIQVSATRPWTPTGITVQKGDVIRFSSSGEIQFGPGAENRSGVNGKEGNYAPRATMPRVLVGGLIGRIGNAQPFGIGSQATITAPDSGQLFLGINDSDFSDNSGDYSVSVAASGSGGAIRR